MPIFCLVVFLAVIITAPTVHGEPVADSTTQLQQPMSHQSVATYNSHSSARTGPNIATATSIGASERDDRATAPVRLLFYLLLAFGAGATVKGAWRTARVLSMDGLNKMRFRKFRSLSPMVIRSLESVGTSLWGKNRLWVRNYSITTRSDRWLLCEGKREIFFRKRETRNCLEVCLRDTNLKVRITLLNGVRGDRVLECRSFSEEELVAQLEEFREYVTSGSLLTSTSPGTSRRLGGTASS